MAQSIKVESLPSKKFGALNVYRSINPDEMVFFISGNDGWNKTLAAAARTLAKQGAVVVGIDINHYWSFVQKSTEPCVYLSEDFEALSRYLQTKYNFDAYHSPVLVGYGSGATLVYSLIAQSPNTTYRGGIGLGFNPNINTKKKICSGSGLHVVVSGKSGNYTLRPRADMNTPFFVINGQFDESFQPLAASRFIDSIPGAKIFQLPYMAHGLSKSKNWMPRFLSCYDKIVNPGTIKKFSPDFPLEIVNTDSNPNMPLVFSISGDGGWKGFIHGLSSDLSKAGIPTVGLDALSYFWKKKSPEQATADISSIVNHYLQEWHRKSFILLGYSFGADVIPFVVNQMPEQLKDKLDMIVLLSPDSHADFEFHFASWLDRSSSQALLVLPELKKMKNINTLVFYGRQEKDSLAFELPKNFKEEFVEGGHGYENNHEHISQVIIKTLEYFRNRNQD